VATRWSHHAGKRHGYYRNSARSTSVPPGLVLPTHPPRALVAADRRPERRESRIAQRPHRGRRFFTPVVEAADGRTEGPASTSRGALEPTKPVSCHSGMTPSTPASAEIAGGREVLYRTLWPGLVRLGVLLTGSRAAGEDVAQDAFLGLLRAPSVQNPEAYLRRSVVNAVINAGRKAAHERNYVRSLREESILPPEVDELWSAIKHLPPRQRAALVLRFQCDLPEREIADLLGCKPGTVKSMTARALARLREEMVR
jgi:RNA polymerase sigma factor (sigma-70 family)